MRLLSHAVRPVRLVGLLLLLARLVAAADPTPLVRAHAHNDYEHPRPLLDALDQGFCSVEADVWLVTGRLLIAHSPDKITRERTLQALYLDPLRERVRKNGGHVYPNGPEFNLLIDLKSRGTNVYPALRATLSNYSDILTTFRDGKKQIGAITVIFTGDRSKDMFAGEEVRYGGYDGEWADLNSNDSADLVPWISLDWKKYSSWRGAGAIPQADADQLHMIVEKAHKAGRRVRFWAAPDTPNFWQAILGAGVDLINTDDLIGARKFFEEGRRNSK